MLTAAVPLCARCVPYPAPTLETDEDEVEFSETPGIQQSSCRHCLSQKVGYVQRWQHQSAKSRSGPFWICSRCSTDPARIAMPKPQGRKKKEACSEERRTSPAIKPWWSSYMYRCVCIYVCGRAYMYMYMYMYVFVCPCNSEW
jgi:hypothetical protein